MNYMEAPPSSDIERLHEGAANLIKAVLMLLEEGAQQLRLCCVLREAG